MPKSESWMFRTQSEACADPFCFSIFSNHTPANPVSMQHPATAAIPLKLAPTGAGGSPGVAAAVEFLQQCHRVRFPPKSHRSSGNVSCSYPPAGTIYSGCDMFCGVTGQRGKVTPGMNTKGKFEFKARWPRPHHLRCFPCHYRVDATKQESNCVEAKWYPSPPTPSTAVKDAVRTPLGSLTAAAINLGKLKMRHNIESNRFASSNYHPASMST